MDNTNSAAIGTAGAASALPTLATFNLETATLIDLELRRRAIFDHMRQNQIAFDDWPLEILHEIAIIARALKTKNAGPPKTTKPKGARARAAAAPQALSDFDDLLTE